jgi:hypothetical protein
MGIPAEDAGNPFGIKAIERCVSPLSLGPPVVFGVDLGKKVDWTVICGLDADGAVCFLDRFQMDWPSTANRIRNAIGGTQTFIDSTGLGDPLVDGLQRELGGQVQGFVFTNRSKQQLMTATAAAIQNGEITFPDGYLVEELKSFRYEYSASGVKYSAPEGLHDDAVCALALAVYHRAQAGQGFEVRVISA